MNNQHVRIKCLNANGYQLTEGAIYIAIFGIEKDDADDTSWGWRWPDYVTVVDDKGREVKAHASRFEVVEV